MPDLTWQAKTWEPFTLLVFPVKHRGRVWWGFTYVSGREPPSAHTITLTPSRKDAIAKAREFASRIDSRQPVEGIVVSNARLKPFRPIALDHVTPKEGE